MSDIYYRRIGLWLWLAAALLWLTPLHAEEAVPVVGGSITRDYARITFEWPETVYFTATAKGKTLTITFDRHADPEFGPLLTQLHPYVLHAARRPDGRTIVLTLDKPYHIRTFVSDTVGGVDLLDIDPNAKREASAAPPLKLKPALPKQADASALANLAPAAGNPAKPEAAKEAPDKPEPAAPPPAAEGNDSMVGASEAEKVKAEKATHVNAAGETIVSVSPGDDAATLRFPFDTRVAAAVFVRSHMLWIVFNEPMALDLSQFGGGQKSVIGKPELLTEKTATILRLPIDDNAYVNVAKEDKSFEWAVLVTQEKHAVEHPLKVSVATEPPAPPHVFVAALEMADSINVQDPLVGDPLVITPLFSTGSGMGETRDFVEFTLINTAQGIVVAKKSDDVEVAQLRNGLRISLPHGTSLTPGLPEMPQAATLDSMQSNATLFPYESWKPRDTDPVKLREEINEQLHRIVESENPQEANEARLRLAELYLGQGLAAETLGLLDGISRTNPAFYRSAKLSALRGAANFLMYRFADAARDFGASELNNNKEIAYWRSMVADLLGAADQSYDYMDMNADYISKYPPLFRQRLAIVAADRAIGAKEYNTALKIFDTLSHDNLLEPINNYANFLVAKISADTGQENDALENWDKLAEDYKHPFVQARAEFTRIVWGMDHGTLSKDDAIERLERLRLSWHGDGLELSVLTLLGALYLEKKDYVNAMRIWNDGVQSFPNTAESIDMSHKMEETFIVMFNDGAADSLSPLEALGLYYEYRHYTPTGNTGNEMIARLADRLVMVDLLDQAESLLDHQMRYNTQKEQRSDIGARLATVYMLNHQPKKALEALEDSVFGGNAEAVRTVRNRLTAQAMAETDQQDRALQTLGNDNSADAALIRLNIYWRQKDWPKLIAGVEAMLKERKDITAPVTLEESNYLIKLALAYEFENNAVQLQYLRDYFGPLMAGNPNKPVFDFVTNPDIALTPTNFDEIIKNLSDTRSFVDNYKAHIQAKGLDAILKPKEPPPP